MTELAIPTTLADRIEYSRAMAPADLLPQAFREKPANVLLAMEAGISLHKSAVEIMQNAHVINGKLGFSAEFQRALVLESGHRIRVYMDGDVAVAQGIRSDDPEFTYKSTWTWERAVTAGLTTGKNAETWKKNRIAMLKARATTELCRDAFADVIRGYRSADELQDISAQAEAVAATVTSNPGDVLRAAAGLAPKEASSDADVIDAEIIETPAAVDPDVQMISDPQRRKMMALFKEKGFKDRDDRLGYVTEIIGIDCASSSDLTWEQASQVIDSLGKLDTPAGDPS